MLGDVRGWTAGDLALGGGSVEALGRWFFLAKTQQTLVWLQAFLKSGAKQRLIPCPQIRRPDEISMTKAYWQLTANRETRLAGPSCESVNLKFKFPIAWNKAKAGLPQSRPQPPSMPTCLAPRLCLTAVGVAQKRCIQPQEPKLFDKCWCQKTLAPSVGSRI